MRVEGLIEQPRVSFPLLEVRHEAIRALDHKLAPVAELPLSREVLAVTSGTDPLAVKLFRVGGQEWNLKLASSAERDVLVLFVEYCKVG